LAFCFVLVPEADIEILGLLNETEIDEQEKAVAI
jgi:hypothetical protein